MEQELCTKLGIPRSLFTRLRREFSICSPTPALCPPRNRLQEKQNGKPCSIEVISWAERHRWPTSRYRHSLVGCPLRRQGTQRRLLGRHGTDAVLRVGTALMVVLRVGMALNVVLRVGIALMAVLRVGTALMVVLRVGMTLMAVLRVGMALMAILRVGMALWSSSG